MRLFHFSQDSGIGRFEPRPHVSADHPIVWAVGEDRMHNYLVPRDCPRVCFTAGSDSRADDIERLLDGARAVVAIEQSWLARVEDAVLYRYAMPENDFVLRDAGACYWVSEASVTPLGMDTVRNLPMALSKLNVSLRVLPSLWTLHDDIAASSLVFSMIRMRNAAPRD